MSGLFYGGRRIYGPGGLNSKRALVSATLGGRENMFGIGAIHGELTGPSSAPAIGPFESIGKSSAASLRSGRLVRCTHPSADPP